MSSAASIPRQHIFHSSELQLRDDKKNPILLDRWVEIGHNVYQKSPESINSLPAGIYQLKVDDGRLLFERQFPQTDELLSLEGSQEHQVFEEIQKFWESGDNYHEWGFLHRRGIILYGPQGCGKTGIVTRLGYQLVEDHEGIILIGNNASPDLITNGIKAIRAVEKDRPIIVQIEDIDAYIQRTDEADVLSMLDGQDSCDNILFIATTNYMGRLDPRITQRPRRFDVRVEILPPSKETRKDYFIKKLSVPPEDAEALAKKTDRFTFAGLSDLVLRTRVLMQDEDESISKVREVMEMKVDNSKPLGPEREMGFGARALR